MDVLRGSHHGADNASDAVYFRQIEPEIAIISLGNGKGYGHPRLGTIFVKGTRYASAYFFKPSNFRIYGVQGFAKFLRYPGDLQG